MERVLCLMIGYCFGLFQTGYIYGKLHGIDIREHGSGNAGTTNVGRILGRKAGAVVYIGDISKTLIALGIVRYPVTAGTFVFISGICRVRCCIGTHFPILFKI